ncbi:hypothetical protein [Bradyrhizobium ottawaense]|uniref:hypothetical protein n=1 Tax=Bradyrhizobium ottawaense TaxID=931866 RepID=UPI0030F3F9B3
MTVPRMLQLRPQPKFKLDMIPESERRNADIIRMNIAQLHTRATDFWTGKALFDSLNRQRGLTYQLWQVVSARDCMMSIYHFGRTIEGIDLSLGQCRSLRGIIDATAKRDARKRFEKSFPSYIKIRHALAHSAERTHTEANTKRHSKKGPIDRAGLGPEGMAKVFGPATMAAAAGIEIMMDGLLGHRFTTTWEGEVVECDINDASGKILDEIVDAFWGAFSPVIVPAPTPPPTKEPSVPPAPPTSDKSDRQS